MIQMLHKTDFRETRVNRQQVGENRTNDCTASTGSKIVKKKGEKIRPVTITDEKRPFLNDTMGFFLDKGLEI